MSKSFSVARLAVAALLALATCLAHAQASFATRPVRIVVPYPPGGGIDVLARAMAPELSTLWGQPVVVENIAGAGGIVGTDRVATAPGDGHMLLMATNPVVVGNRFLYKSLPYDPDRGLAPVTMVLQTGQMAVAHPSLPASTMKELSELARKSPGKIAYSSFGYGSQPQLFFETIARRPDFAEKQITSRGVELIANTPAEFAGVIKAEVVSTGEMVRAAGVKPE